MPAHVAVTQRNEAAAMRRACEAPRSSWGFALMVDRTQQRAQIELLTGSDLPWRFESNLEYGSRSVRGKNNWRLIVINRPSITKCYIVIVRP